MCTKAFQKPEKNLSIFCPVVMGVFSFKFVTTMAVLLSLFLIFFFVFLVAEAGEGSIYYSP